MTRVKHGKNFYCYSCVINQWYYSIYRHANSSLETSTGDYSAEVDVNNIADGTPGFDTNNDPGNDANEHNGIVRSNDIVTTPINVVNTADRCSNKY